MEPIQQTLITPNPRQPSTNAPEPVYGADFTFSDFFTRKPWPS